MFIVGLTGGICSGKTTISNLFEKKGIFVSDADIAARETVQTGSYALKEIFKKFGKNILIKNELNREKLKNIIFSDPKAKKWLERLTHPIIRELLIQKLKSAKSKYCILSSPLLIESGQIDIVNRVLIIDFNIKYQAQRVAKRDNVSLDLAYKIIQSQISQKERLKYADDVIYNTLDIKFLEKQVNIMHKKYLKLCKL